MDNPECRRVLIIVEDETLAELIDETLRAAGHETSHVAGDRDVEALFASRFDAVVVDLDTRARNGARLVTRLRRWLPTSTIVALLPCGGLPPGAAPVPYHLAVEKPARLGAVLSAVHASRRTQ
jgi:CheY-like chemotaxis protein